MLAVLLAGGSSRAMLASAKLSCNFYFQTHTGTVYAVIAVVCLCVCPSAGMGRIQLNLVSCATVRQVLVHGIGYD